MEKFKCRCSKMLFEMTDNEIIIKCRHCKRYVIVHTQGIDQVEFANNVYPEMFQQNGKKVIIAHL
jgi:hypothetical protein